MERIAVKKFHCRDLQPSWESRPTTHSRGLASPKGEFEARCMWTESLSREEEKMKKKTQKACRHKDAERPCLNAGTSRISEYPWIASNSLWEHDGPLDGTWWNTCQRVLCPLCCPVGLPVQACSHRDDLSELVPQEFPRFYEKDAAMPCKILSAEMIHCIWLEVFSID